VYQIGKRHGYELDRGHVKDFLAVAGVGMASQVVEGFAPPVARRAPGSVAGGLVGGLARGATGAGFSFATTYALGHAARRYYAGGRKLSAASCAICSPSSSDARASSSRATPPTSRPPRNAPISARSSAC
jgi:hypothetical protein